MIDYLAQSIEPIQDRINELNVIHDYVKFDDVIMKKYGPMVGELFGIVNVHTKIVDGIINHLDDVDNGLYDGYPPQSVGALIFYWDTEIAISLSEIESSIADLEKYLCYFQEVEESEEISGPVKRPSIH
jgi:hypothetical protein